MVFQHFEMMFFGRIKTFYVSTSKFFTLKYKNANRNKISHRLEMETDFY